MPNYKRTVNKNLLFSLIKYNGLDLATLGQNLNPPLTASVVCRICNPDHPHKPEKRIIEISKFFNIPDPILFPYVPVQDTEPSSQEKSKYFGGI